MISIFKTNSLRCNSELIVDSILNENSDIPTIFVAPESSKASIERLVLTHLIKEEDKSLVSDGVSDLAVVSAFSNGDIVSFLRLAGRINEMCGNRISGLGDSLVLRTAIYRVLAEHHADFKIFGKHVGRFEFVDGLIELLGDFTRYGIDSDTFVNCYENASEDEDRVFLDKVHDFKLLSDYLYELDEDYDLKLLSNEMAEANKLMDRLIADKALLETRRYREFNRFVNSRFVVIGFGANRLLTPEELKFITNLHLLGASFYFYPISSDGLSLEGDLTVYSNGDEFIKSIVKAVPDTIVQDLGVSSDKLSPLGIAAYNYALKNELDSDLVTKTDAIKCFSIKNLDDRIALISNEIIRLTREENYRYKDIRIVCVDDSIVDRLRSVMSRYGLAAFIDRKILVTNTPVFRLVSLLVELPIHYFLIEDVLSILRTGLLGVPVEDIDAFENYCVKCNITDGRRIFDPEFYISSSNHPMHIYRDGKDVLAAEYLWEHVVSKCLMPLHDVALSINEANTISDKANLLANYVDSFKDLIEALAFESVDRNDPDRASAIVRGYKEVITLLVNFTLPMNDVKITQEHFLSLLRIDMRNKCQGSIPLMVDSVDIVTPEQTYITPCKVMFVIGATAENFPYRRSTDGLLNPNELKKLSDKLPDKNTMKNRSDFIVSSMMLNSVEDILYFVTEDGIQPSRAYSFMLNYSSLEEGVNCFKDTLYGTSVERRHDFTNATIDSDVVASLLGSNVYVSVSSIERFNECHMKYMINDVLKIRERDDGRDVGTNDMGTIVHSMYQVYLEELKAKNFTLDDYRNLSEEFSSNPEVLEEISSRLFFDYCNSSTSPNEKTDQFRDYAGVKAKRIFAKSLPAIVSNIVETSFIPVDFELSIRDSGCGMKVDVGDIEFSFIGFIDRVDRNESLNKLRVIDYKTGDKEVKLGKALAGVQIQLFAYANSISNLGEVSDVGYFPIGLSPQNKASLTITPKMAKLNDEDFVTVGDYVSHVIKNSCMDIAKGKSDAIVNSTFAGNYSPCAFCKYASSCGNDSKKPMVRVETKLHDETIKKAKASDYLAEMKIRLEN